MISKYQHEDGSEFMIVPFSKGTVGAVLLGATEMDGVDGAFLTFSENTENMFMGSICEKPFSEIPPFLALHFFVPESIDVMIESLERCKEILKNKMDLSEIGVANNECSG